MSAADNTATSQAPEHNSQYLTFVLDGVEYAIDILKVQEIKSWTPVTKVPRSPAHMLGVINLRGAIVPVVDLRRRFHLPIAEFSSKTAVVIVRTQQDSSEKVMGLVVDAVAEVYHLRSDQIQASTTISSNIDDDFIQGLARTEEELLIVLNLEKIVDAGVISNAMPSTESQVSDND